MQNNPNQPFDQNMMNNIMQTSQKMANDLKAMNMTPQQYLEQAMINGQVTQDRYEWARQMANQVLGTKY